jgi:hypothetical protein
MNTRGCPILAIFPFARVGSHNVRSFHLQPTNRNPVPHPWDVFFLSDGWEPVELHDEVVFVERTTLFLGGKS